MHKVECMVAMTICTIHCRYFIYSSGVTEEEDDEDEDDLDNLIGRFQRLTASDYAICHPQIEQNVSRTQQIFGAFLTQPVFQLCVLLSML